MKNRKEYESPKVTTISIEPDEKLMDGPVIPGQETEIGSKIVPID